MSKARIPAADWLLAETVRLHEEHLGRSADDDTANALAQNAGGALGWRLARRAAALPAASAIRADLARLRGLLVRLVLVILVLAVLAGSLAALASTTDREVGVLLAAASLLLLPTFMLLLWLLLMLSTRPTRASASLSGGLVGWGLRRLGPRLLDGALASETVAATAGLLRTRPGRWLMSTVTHAFWTVYSLSALTVLVLLFSIAQYDLSWGTTLLADDTVVRLIAGLAWLPAHLGLVEQPDAAWILAGREGGQPGGARAEWARFLLALVAVYGLLPRALLAACCGLAAVVGLRRMRLDTRQPGYLRLAGTLTERDDPQVEGQPPEPAPLIERSRPAHADGPPLLVGVELERQDWPGRVPGRGWQVLGRADSRGQRQQMLAAAAGFMSPPMAVIAQCSALRTPDDGTARFLVRLADAAETVLVIWLDEAGRLEARGIPATERIADWRALAGRVGGQLVVLDADRPDAGALAELLEMAGAQA